MAPLRKVSFGSGTISSGSTVSSLPRPLHSGHAPKGLLNENNRGSISGMVKPETGQANFDEKTICFGLPSASFSSAYSMRAMPSASSSAVSKLSESRAARSGRTAMRSTTTSMSCFSFLSSAGVSAIS